MTPQLLSKILLFSYLLTFAAGYPAIILLSSYFLRQKKAITLYIHLYVIAYFTIFIFQGLILFFPQSLPLITKEIIVFITRMAIGLQVIFGAVFIFKLLDRKMDSKTLLLYSTVAILVFFLGVIKWAGGRVFLQELYLIKMLLYPLSFSLWMTLGRHKKNIKFSELKYYANGIHIILGLSIPIWIITDVLFYFIKDLNNPSGIAPVYFINVLNIIFTLKYISGLRKNKSVKLSDVFRITNFTKKEKEIIRYLMCYLSNKEIAEKTGVSTQTVKNHLYNIFQKADVKSRMEFLQWIRLQANFAFNTETGT